MPQGENAHFAMTLSCRRIISLVVNRGWDQRPKIEKPVSLPGGTGFLTAHFGAL